MLSAPWQSGRETGAPEIDFELVTEALGSNLCCPLLDFHLLLLGGVSEMIGWTRDSAATRQSAIIIAAAEPRQASLGGRSKETPLELQRQQASERSQFRGWAPGAKAGRWQRANCVGQAGHDQHQLPGARPQATFVLIWQSEVS